MVWTVADGPPKAAFSGSGQQIGTQDGETAEKLVRRILNDNLTLTQVVRPDEREFASAVPEAHRKGEKAYHVKAFRGSKEGTKDLMAAAVAWANSPSRVSFLPLDGDFLWFQEAAGLLCL